MSEHLMRQRLLDAAFVLGLGTMALAGLRHTYDGPRYLVVGVIGLATGAAVAVLTESLRVSTAIAIGMLTYVFTCGPVVFSDTTIAAVLPSGQTLAAIGDGTINGWSGMLTTEPPLPTTSGPLLVPPFLTGLAAGLAAVMVARLSLALAPLVPMGSLLAVVILFGTSGSEPPTLFACAFIGLVLLWGTLRHRRRVGPARTEASVLRRLLTPAVLLLGAALAVAAFDTVVAPVAADQRYVLRDHVIPPFDPSAYPSPLSGFRQYEKRLRDEVLFTVEGLPAGARIRLATMDSYDGVVWNVVNGDGGPADGSGVFSRVGSRIAYDGGGRVARVRVTIDAYDGIWMPTAGGLTSVRFEGERAEQLAASFRYNTKTSIGVVPTGLAAGDAYTIEVVIDAEPAPQELTGKAFGSVTLPQMRGVPDEVATAAAAWAGASGGGVTTAHLLAILDTLQHGAFSDGDPDAGVPSPPGHGAKRVRDFLTGSQLVGDDEQYAATLGLMARELGIPARVVLGVRPPVEDFDGKVTGEMVSAWVEVNIAGLGWVPLDPTPPVESKPRLVHIREETVDEGQVLQPPVPQAQPPRPVPPPQADEAIEDIDCLTNWFCFSRLPGWVQWLLRYVAPPLLAILTVLVGIVLAKAVRRRRRRRRGSPVTRISGAWQEVVDRLRDHGYPSSAYDTRLDIAGRVGGDAIRRLADLADAAVFGPGEPPDDLAREVWNTARAAVREVTGERTRWQRFLAAINPASLRPDARTIAALAALRRYGPRHRAPTRRAPRVPQAASP